MNEQIRNILLIICIVIVLLIFIDLIFNFTGIRVEGFKTGPKINSIISKNDGRMFNIKILTSTDDINTWDITIDSPVHTNTNISANTDNTIGEKLSNSSDPDQKFTMYKITGLQDFNRISSPLAKERGAGSPQCVEYPFYIVTPSITSKDKMSLAYEPGRLFLAPLGKYTNQRWDISSNSNPVKSVLTHKASNTNIGSINNAKLNDPGNEAFDPNKVKINLNLTDELKKQLFGVDGSGGSDGSSGSCGTHIKRDAIASICPGCDADKL